ncbi:TIGR03986 family CRISPR-associated RAMP protein [Paenibacillus terrae]|uniref:TIGR03986 family CRISPR-associated RAMP protein n=1 Tax=Paenibacillus terrae TaxID=159743 RepID=A0A0D7WWH3_9BACL|nr:TIGR03986 family CRISPR-associated RAMP protein [Paenibacillus terrae]KJD43083.1 hypothetical protein QD47_24545 [Paenibacillus terrae]
MKSNQGVAPEERFINPYNFVPLEAQCERQPINAYKEGKELYSGYIDCSIHLKTPIFIPNSSGECVLSNMKSKNDDKYEKSYDFFSYDDLSHCKPGDRKEVYSVPVIPGSEIRGVVRSVFEAAFNGCLSTIDTGRVLHRRSAANDVKKPGILRYDTNQKKWFVYSCDRIMLNRRFDKLGDKHKHGKFMSNEEYNGYDEGQKIYFKKSDNKYDNKYYMPYVVDDFFVGEPTQDMDNLWQEGYLHKGEPFGTKKHHESVFYFEKESHRKYNKLTVDEKTIYNFEAVLNLYEENNNEKKEGSPHTGYAAYKKQTLSKIKNKEDILVFYSAANGNQAQYLSPSMISQQVYYAKIKEMLTKNGGYEPCEDRHCVCPACALFGMIPPDEQNTRSRTARQALGSRVRFTDATLLESSLLKERKDYYRGDIRLPAMGEPKPGAVEFYTKKPSDYQEGALFWTYDYLVKKEGKTRTPIKDSAFGIRGRKFYWHSENWKQHKDKLHGKSTEFLKENINTNMTVGVRPLNHEKCPAFQFKVYYEHLTWDELNQLKWSLDFNDSACSHKIGRGKPLGFGSIQLKIEQVMQRTIDLQTGEWFMKQFPDTCREELPESDAMKDLKLITGWESKPTATISYPQIRLERTTEPREQQNNVNEEASHRWFTENAKHDKKVLPTIQEEMSANEASNWLKKIKVK